MKLKLAFLSCTLLAFQSLYAQSDSINKVDSVGKKNGKWIVYLNSYWKEVNAKEQASYFRYTYYDHGTNLYPMGRGGKNWKVEPSTTNTGISNPQMLDGEYKWIDKKGQIRSIQVFNKGMSVSNKWFNASGKLTEFFDYKKKWREQPHTYVMYVPRKNDKFGCYYFRKGQYGWMGYGSLYDSTDVEKNKVVGDSTFATVKNYLMGKIVFETGQIRIKGVQEAIAHGPYKQWYPNGQKKYEGLYHYGKRLGSWKSWDEKGKENKTIEYQAP